MGRFTYSSHVLVIFGNGQWRKLLGQPTKRFSHELARQRLTINSPADHATPAVAAALLRNASTLSSGKFGEVVLELGCKDMVHERHQRRG